MTERKRIFCFGCETLSRLTDESIRNSLYSHFERREECRIESADLGQLEMVRIKMDHAADQTIVREVLTTKALRNKSAVFIELAGPDRVERLIVNRPHVFDVPNRTVRIPLKIVTRANSEKAAESKQTRKIQAIATRARQQLLFLRRGTTPESRLYDSLMSALQLQVHLQANCVPGLVRWTSDSIPSWDVVHSNRDLSRLEKLLDESYVVPESASS